MKIIMLPLSELTPNPRNVRLHSPKQIEEYKRSVRDYGQNRPIVVDEDKVILIGNGLYQTMKELGMTEAACYVKEGLSEHQKLKMMMADNKIYSLGVDNLTTIESIIAELGAASDFDIPGYDADLLETLTFNPLDADDFMGGYGVLNDSTKASMQKAAERYEEEDAEFAASAEEVTPNGPGEPLQSPAEDGSGQGHVADSSDGKPLETAVNEFQRRFIVCPKCGEKIWL